MSQTLDNLIDRYLDDAASPDEIDQLDAWVAEDPHAADALYRSAHVEILLHDSFAPAGAADGRLICGECGECGESDARDDRLGVGAGAQLSGNSPAADAVVVLGGAAPGDSGAEFGRLEAVGALLPDSDINHQRGDIINAIPQEGGAANQPLPTGPRPAQYEAGFHSVLTPSRSAASRPSTWRRPWPRVWAAAACVLVGLTVAWAASAVSRGGKWGGAHWWSDSTADSRPAGLGVQLTPSGSGVMIDNPWGARQATADARLIPNEQVRTGQSGSAVLAYDGESTRVSLSPRTNLVLAGVNDKRLSLVGGRIDCAVARQAPDHPLVILTPQAQLTVVGTRFQVTAGRDWTRLQVSEGVVRALRNADGATVDVSAGQYIDIAGFDPITPKSTPPSMLRDREAFWAIPQ